MSRIHGPDDENPLSNSEYPWSNGENTILDISYTYNREKKFAKQL